LITKSSYLNAELKVPSIKRPAPRDYAATNVSLYLSSLSGRINI